MGLVCEWRHARKQWSWEFEGLDKHELGVDFGPCKQIVGLSANEADSWSWGPTMMVLRSWIKTIILRIWGPTRQLGSGGWTMEDDSWVPAFGGIEGD